MFKAAAEIYCIIIIKNRVLASQMEVGRLRNEHLGLLVAVGALEAQTMRFEQHLGIVCFVLELVLVFLERRLMWEIQTHT